MLNASKVSQRVAGQETTGAKPIRIRGGHAVPLSHIDGSLTLSEREYHQADAKCTRKRGDCAIKRLSVAPSLRAQRH
jgi:hypothetical protein